MESHARKKIAPIVITVIALIYYGFYFGIIIKSNEPLLMKILFGVIPVLLAAVMIFVCIQRIKEINGGEEDDLSKY